MDSTLLDQIRHLCRDRAAYERLKAILVQQERVHQLSWEERYDKLLSTSLFDKSSGDAASSDTQTSEIQTSNIFSNIIAREKALAQLADAIQRSPSLDLVLQISVQVAQKLLQVDRVAIFRRYPDGRGEFVTDAIAAGLTSLANMPERQLSLARHMIDSTQVESVQAIDSIRSSNLSSHILNLLEQIGISSYAANKIYTGQEIWGTLVAFHGSAYHRWAESDRISLALIASQIGIAISLTNLRQQSQDLTNSLQVLQIELDNLQDTVIEIAKTKYQPLALSEITTENSIESEQITQPVLQNPIVEKHNNNNGNDLVLSDPEVSLNENIHESDRDLDAEDRGSPSLTEQSDESRVPDRLQAYPTYQNGLPPLFLIEESSEPLSDTESELEDSVSDEDLAPDRSAIQFTKNDISYVIVPDTLKVISVLEEDEPEEFSEPETIVFSDLTDTSLSSLEPASSEPEAFLQEAIASEIAEIDPIKLAAYELEEIKSNEVELEVNIQDSLVLVEPSELTLPEEKKSEMESEVIEEETVNQEESELEAQLIQNLQARLETSETDISEEDRDPALEPQFIETILTIAGNDLKANDFVVEVIDSYLESAPRLVQAIDKAIAANDRERLLQSLNTLRTSSDYIGAIALSHQCRHLESAILGNYVVLIYACLSQVAIEVQRATDALRIERSRYSPQD
jgi:HPt (histidine-containing phosphotransfer) domain-containing protein